MVGTYALKVTLKKLTSDQEVFAHVCVSSSDALFDRITFVAPQIGV